MPRPERVFTEEEIDEIEKLAPSLTQQQMADYFSISINTLKQIMKRLWLSQRMGWTEKSRQEISGPDGSPIQKDYHITLEVINPGDLDADKS